MKTIITIQHTQSIHHINGMAGGVSFMFENNEGKHFVKRMGDLSFIA